jgi:hypothetical protein
MNESSLKKSKKRGRVINSFNVEFDLTSSDPAMNLNPSNPHAQLSDEERLKDLIDIFGEVWSESCRESSNELNRKR